jgi:hypothetical protein
MLTVAFVSIALLGSGLVQAQFAGDDFSGKTKRGAANQFPGGGASKRDVDSLRAEITKLRQELEEAVKAIKRLQTPQQANAEPGPRYQGWPASFWLKQFEDVDPKYRLEAIKALGALAAKNKDLIPVLLASLKDENDEVGGWGAYALAGLGTKVVPDLVAVLKDKTALNAQIHAAYALSIVEPRPKTAIPALTQALKEIDWKLRRTAIQALGEFGPDAKSALPIMADVFAQYVKKINSDTKQERDKGMPVRLDNASAPIAAITLRAMTKIDPKGTVPTLALVMKEKDWTFLRDTAVKMLSDIGPDARPVLPALVDNLDLSVSEMKKLRVKEGRGSSSYDQDRRSLAILRAIVKIDPDSRGTLPRTIRELSNNPGFSTSERGTVEDWEDGIEALRKKYGNGP